MADRQNPVITNDTGTPAPPIPIREMSEAEFRRLINHFLWLVIDEAEALRVFGQAELEHVGGVATAWGPWPQADCAAVLLRWYDAGLLALHDEAGPISEQETRALLAASESWADILRHPSLPYLAATEQGANVTDEGWFDLVRDLRQRE